MSQQGMICTRCFVDTGCSPDLSGLSFKNANDLCNGWLCSECMDNDEEIQAFEAEAATEKKGTQP